MSRRRGAWALGRFGGRLAAAPRAVGARALAAVTSERVRATSSSRVVLPHHIIIIIIIISTQAGLGPRALAVVPVFLVRGRATRRSLRTAPSSSSSSSLGTQHTTHNTHTTQHNTTHNTQNTVGLGLSRSALRAWPFRPSEKFPSCDLVARPDPYVTDRRPTRPSNPTHTHTSQVGLGVT